MKFRAVLLASCIVVTGLWGCDPPKNDGVPFISTQAGYRDTMEQVKVLTSTSLTKVDAGETLTEGQIEDLNKAVPLIEGMIKFNPSEFTLFYLKGRVLRAAGNEPDARLALMQAANLVPLDPSPQDRLVMSEVNVELGEILLTEQDFDAALRVASNAIQFDAKNPNGYVLAARVHIEQKDLDLAKVEISKALKLEPKHSEALGLQKLIGMSKKD